MALSLKNILADLKKSKVANHVLDSYMAQDEMCLNVAVEGVRQVCLYLRDHKEYQFHCLVGLCGVDFPEQHKRFEVVYSLLSLKANARLRLKVSVGEGDIVPSIVAVYPTAGWFERETWDMYGIPFGGNPDLRRLLTDYGFQGHPLRKDFPLTGYVEVRYDDEKKRVVYEPVTLAQDFRTFDFMSPWEGMTEIQLPGDEKAVKPAFMFEKKAKEGK